MKNLLSFSQSGGYGSNEDAFLTLPHPHDESVLICALADGQGGRPGGHAAAERACAVAIDTAATYSPKQLTKSKSWVKILSEVDKSVHQEPDAGFTTLVGLCITQDAVCGGSSGDSAAVLLNVYDRFHTLTADQQKNPPVGSGKAMFTPFAESLIDPWQVVMMSDGLYKYVGWGEVTTTIKRYQSDELLNTLVGKATSAGNGFLRDDTTIIVVTGQAR